MILALIIIIIIISACPVLAEERYIERDARVCTQVHFNICKEKGVNLDNEYWCEHVPKLVETIREGKVTILLNQQVQTDITIHNNKLDVIIRHNEEVDCNRFCNSVRQKYD
jgi:hypothetical protein